MIIVKVIVKVIAKAKVIVKNKSQFLIREYVDGNYHPTST